VADRGSDAWTGSDEGYIENHPVIPTKIVGMPPLLRKEGSLFVVLLPAAAVGVAAMFGGEGFAFFDDRDGREG